MAKFEIDQPVNVTHPVLGGTVVGTVVLNNLKGKYPLLVRAMSRSGDELCMQTGADGDGIIEAIEKTAEQPKHTDVVAYIYADGRASLWQEAGKPQPPYSKPAVGAMKAKRSGDRYFDHQFVDLTEKKEETVNTNTNTSSFLDRIINKAAEQRAEKNVKKPETEIGRFQIKLDEEGKPVDGALDDLPPEVRAIVDKLFGKKDK